MESRDSQDIRLSNQQPPAPSLGQEVLATDGTPHKSLKRQKVTRACDSWSGGSECTYNATYTRGKLVQPVPSSRVTEDSLAYIPVVAEDGLSGGQTKTGAGTSKGATSDLISSRAASPEGEAAAFAGQYTGPTSAYSFLRRAWRRFGMNVGEQAENEMNQAVPIFSYGDKQLPRSSIGIAHSTLPDRQSCADLFSIYFDFAMPTYRFLHQPTVSAWLQSYHEQIEANTERISILPARQAVILMVLATASLFKADNETNPSIHKEPWQASEPFFQAAQMKLASETGRVRLESVQARLAMCLYLLHTSRPNQAWYTFGITTQILTALGMHRARGGPAPKLDAITMECRKRAFWAAYTLDTYLSVILGRPTLIHSDDIDQHYPEPVHDEDLTPNGINATRLQGDSVINASIYHAKITHIAKRALHEEYSVVRHRDVQRLSAAAKLNAEVDEWRASLPIILSGKVHQSSLIQIFQRQIIVLDLAQFFALILINRPLLLIDTKIDNKSNIDACLSAAKSVLDVVRAFVADERTFPSFWYTQHVTFNALSVVYVWLIQRKRGRLSGYNPPHSDEDLYQLAETIQKHLAKATQTNAPSLRYSIILQELQQEAGRLMVKQSRPRPPNLSGLLETPTEGHPYATPANLSESSPSSNRDNSTNWDSISGDFPLDPDIWLQLDSFPFPDLDLDEMHDFT